MYHVTKRFTAGPLTGLVITERTTVEFDAGVEYAECVGSGRYTVEAVWEEPICDHCRKLITDPDDVRDNVQDAVLCVVCDDKVWHEGQMDGFDRAYARERSRGWED